MALEKLSHVLIKNILKNQVGEHIFKRNFNYKKLWGQLASQDTKCAPRQTTDSSPLSSCRNNPLSEKNLAIPLRCYREGRVYGDDLRLLTGLGTLPPDNVTQTPGEGGNGDSPDENQNPKPNQEDYSPPTNPHFRIQAQLSFKVPLTWYASTDPSRIKVAEKSAINC